MASYIFVVLAAFCFHFSHANGASVSDAEKQEIVNSHNEWRKNAGASAMRRLKWNDELARFSEAAVAKCAFDHTTSEQRQNIAGFDYIGENIYVNSAKTTFKEAVDSWGSEEKDYDLKTDQCRAVCGHYTQINWAKTSEVGCAVAQCGNVEGFGHGGYLIFCNYGIGGNMQGEKPFEKGTPGSKCQSEFNLPAGPDGLCGEGDSPTSNVPETKPSADAGPSNGDKPTQDSEDKPSVGNDKGDKPNPGHDKPSNGNEKPNPDDEKPNPSDEKPNPGDDKPNDAECKDEWAHCKDWERHCGRDWTKKSCRKTCNFCGNNGNENNNNGGDEAKPGECKDDIWFCHDYLNECDKEWTQRACRKSCKHCQ